MIFVIIILLTSYGRSARITEVENGLTEAMESSLKNVMEQKAYKINNSDEFIADFLETLLMQLQSESDVTVHILKQDMKKGLLSVEVIETYAHPNGETGTVSVCRTVILDREE